AEEIVAEECRAAGIVADVDAGAAHHVLVSRGAEVSREPREEEAERHPGAMVGVDAGPPDLDQPGQLDDAAEIELASGVEPADPGRRGGAQDAIRPDDLVRQAVAEEEMLAVGVEV